MARLFVRCSDHAPGQRASPNAGPNVTGKMYEQTGVVIRSGVRAPRTPTLGTKADAARPPASRLIQVTARFRAALTMAQGLLPSPVAVPQRGWCVVSTDSLWWLGVFLSLIVAAVVMWILSE